VKIIAGSSYCNVILKKFESKSIYGDRLHHTRNLSTQGTFNKNDDATVCDGEDMKL